MKVPVSVVIITKNEEKMIEDCLRSVYGWAEEIVLVDDESSDKTKEIAAKYTDKLFSRRMDIEGKHRNWAYAQAKCDWVLSLDADERVTEELKQEIIKAIAFPADYTHFNVNLRNYIGNYWIKGGGWYPAPKVRLFLRDKFKYEEVEVHPRIFCPGRCGWLDGDIIHYSYENFAEFITSQNKQTTLEAKKWHNLLKEKPKKVRMKMNLFNALYRSLDRFIRTFFAKRGYRDGFVGFMIALFASLYQIFSYAKFWEMVKNENSISR